MKATNRVLKSVDDEMEPFKRAQQIETVQKEQAHLKVLEYEANRRAARDRGNAASLYLLKEQAKKEEMFELGESSRRLARENERDRADRIAAQTPPPVQFSPPLLPNEDAVFYDHNYLGSWTKPATVFQAERVSSGFQGNAVLDAVLVNEMQSNDEALNSEKRNTLRERRLQRYDIAIGKQKIINEYDSILVHLDLAHRSELQKKQNSLGKKLPAKCNSRNLDQQTAPPISEKQIKFEKEVETILVQSKASYEKSKELDRMRLGREQSMKKWRCTSRPIEPRPFDRLIPQEVHPPISPVLFSEGSVTNLPEMSNIQEDIFKHKDANTQTSDSIIHLTKPSSTAIFSSSVPLTPESNLKGSYSNSTPVNSIAVPPVRKNIIDGLSVGSSNLKLGSNVNIPLVTSNSVRPLMSELMKKAAAKTFGSLSDQLCRKNKLACPAGNENSLGLLGKENKNAGSSPKFFPDPTLNALLPITTNNIMTENPKMFSEPYRFGKSSGTMKRKVVKVSLPEVVDSQCDISDVKSHVVYKSPCEPFKCPDKTPTNSSKNGSNNSQNSRINIGAQCRPNTENCLLLELPALYNTKEVSGSTSQVPNGYTRDLVEDGTTKNEALLSSKSHQTSHSNYFNLHEQEYLPQIQDSLFESQFSESVPIHELGFHQSNSSSSEILLFPTQNSQPSAAGSDNIVPSNIISSLPKYLQHSLINELQQNNVSITDENIQRLLGSVVSFDDIENFIRLPPPVSFPVGIQGTEGVVPHELSTIMEVDTPHNSLFLGSNSRSQTEGHSRSYGASNRNSIPETRCDKNILSNLVVPASDPKVQVTSSIPTNSPASSTQSQAVWSDILKDSSISPCSTTSSQLTEAFSRGRIKTHSTPVKDKKKKSNIDCDIVDQSVTLSGEDFTLDPSTVSLLPWAPQHSTQSLFIQNKPKSLYSLTPVPISEARSVSPAGLKTQSGCSLLPSGEYRDVPQNTALLDTCISSKGDSKRFRPLFSPVNRTNVSPVSSTSLGSLMTLSPFFPISSVYSSVQNTEGTTDSDSLLSFIKLEKNLAKDSSHCSLFD